MQPQTPQMIDGMQLDPKIIKVAKAIRQVESGGDYSAVGDSGQAHGAFQFNEKTGKGWKNYAKEFLGNESAPMDKGNQNKVVYMQVKRWRDQGLQPDEIDALWNGAKKDPTTGSYVHLNPERAQKFREALTGGGGFNPNPYSKPSAGTALAQVVQPPAVQTEPEKDTLEGKLNGRAQDISKIWSSPRGSMNPLSAGVQTVGAIAGGVNDIAQKGLELIPGVKQVEGLIGKGVGYLANTGIGKSVIGAGQNFAQAHPELSADIGSVANIGGAYGLLTGAGALKDAAGSALAKATGKDALETIAADIAPKLGPKATAKTVARQGLIKSAIKGEIKPVLDSGTREIAQTVSEAVPGFSKLGTFAEKVNATKDAIGKVANTLRTNLTSGDIIPVVTREDWNGFLGSVKKGIAENPLIVGDSEKVAEKILNQFQRLLPEQGDITAVDILDARQKLDSWMQGIKGAGVFDPSKENVVSTALRAIRQGANNLMEEKVPEAGVKNLLRKQTLLYDAVDNMSTSAAKEIGTTKFTRFKGKHPLVSGLIKKGIQGGATGLGLGAAYEGTKGFLGD